MFSFLKGSSDPTKSTTIEHSLTSLCHLHNLVGYMCTVGARIGYVGYMCTLGHVDTEVTTMNCSASERK